VGATSSFYSASAANLSMGDTQKVSEAGLVSAAKRGQQEALCDS